MTGGRLLGLAASLVAGFSQVHPGLSGAHLLVVVCLIIEVPTWLVWALVPQAGRRAQFVALLLMGTAGGVMAPYAGVGLLDVGVAALAGGVAFELPPGLAVALLGPAAAAVTTAAGRLGWGPLVGPAAASFIGFLLGVGRREYKERAEQAAAMTLVSERADLEHDRAAVLEERNRLAREIHDVLAHTLGALTVQLQALEVLHEQDPHDVDAVREGLRRTRALAGDGLAEARQAVRSLREDATPLEAQLEALCSRGGATLEVSGPRRPLGAEVTVALYRVAQESLTNAAKHAPGAPVSLRLDFEDGSVALSVANGPARDRRGRSRPAALATAWTGSGSVYACLAAMCWPALPRGVAGSCRRG